MCFDILILGSLLSIEETNYEQLHDKNIKLLPKARNKSTLKYFKTKPVTQIEIAWKRFAYCNRGTGHVKSPTKIETGDITTSEDLK